MKETYLADLKSASEKLAKISEVKKRLFYYYLLDCLKKNNKKLEKANQKDIKKAIKAGLAQSVVKALSLTKKNIVDIQKTIEKISKEEHVIGTIIEQKRLVNGLKWQKIRVPLGVILVLYEANPALTLEIICICIKSSNTVILKAETGIENTNEVLMDCIKRALTQSTLPTKSVYLLKLKKYETPHELLKKRDEIDLVIVRGGYKKVREIQKKSSIPVLAQGSGGARIYIDKSADLKMALGLILNSKIKNPVARNSLDTVLVHKDIATKFIPLLDEALGKNGVKSMIETDWNKETLSLSLGIKIVKSVDDAINWIRKYTKHHTEAIVSENRKTIELFTQSIDAASVMVNCSTRFHDGEELGLGAQIGISTEKLHARGPVGANELTSYKWVIYGKGHTK